MNEKVKQLNIRLPQSVHRQMKSKCALDGISLVAAVHELIRAYLDGKVKLKPPSDGAHR